MALLDELFDVKGRVVVVTGAAGQLGQAFIRTFATLGARVFGIDQRVAGAVAPAEDYLEVDVADRQGLHWALAGVCTKMARGLDVLVNNAGVSIFEPFEQRTDERFDWVLGVNLTGVFHGIQSYVRLHDEYHSPKGCIVNIGSHYGVISPDFRIYGEGDRRNSEVYGATKAGVIQMTRYFAVHLAARNIRVNCISPGGIFNPRNPQSDAFRAKYSERVPMGRMGSEEEIVGALIYLAGSAASYTTGQNLIIDGGMTCW